LTFGGSGEDLTTAIGLWSDVALPLTPQNNRVIIVAMGSSRTSSVATSHDDVKLDGVDMNRHVQIAFDTGSHHETLSLWSLTVAAVTTAQLRIQTPNTQHYSYALWGMYTSNPTPIDTGSNAFLTGTSGTITDLQTPLNGAVISASISKNVASALTGISGNGATGSLTADVDVALTNSRYRYGGYTKITSVADPNEDLTLTQSVAEDALWIAATFEA
jgi:hypothetical protein